MRQARVASTPAAAPWHRPWRPSPADTPPKAVGWAQHLCVCAAGR